MPSSPASRASSASRSTCSRGAAGDADRARGRRRRGWSARSPPTTFVAGGAAALAASSIARPPAAWTVRTAGSSGASAATALRDRVRDVVKLQVEEDRQPELGDRGDARRAVGGRRIRGRASPRRHGRGPARASAARAVQVGRVDGDEDRAHAAGIVVGCRFGADRRRRCCRSSASSRWLQPSTISCAHDQPGRQAAEQERQSEQDRQLDVGLDVAPQVERDDRASCGWRSRATRTATTTQNNVFRNCIAERS